MFAAIIKGIPICFSFLMEIFKTQEGGNVKPATKLAVLVFAAFLTYSTYITLIYVEQYHILVKLQYHVEYLNDTIEEKKDSISELKTENRELDAELRKYRIPPPSYNQTEPVNMGTLIAPEKSPVPKATHQTDELDKTHSLLHPLPIPDITKPGLLFGTLVPQFDRAFVMFRRERKDKESESK